MNSSHSQQNLSQRNLSNSMHTRLNAGNFVKKESLEMKLSQREKSSFGINSEGESEKINFIQHQGCSRGISRSWPLIQPSMMG